MSETRALNAALSGPVFHGAATRSALHASERHVERWAPEGASATRSGGMRSLGFADRIAMPWMNAAMQSRGAQMMARPTSDRGTPEVSWLFPRPWFQDELDWMAAARQSAEQAPQFLTTRGTYASARTSMADIAMPMLSADMVAPSMSRGMAPGAHEAAAARADGGSTAGLSAALPPGFAQVQHSLRSYSPSVPFAAASAAEVVAGTIGMASESGLASIAGGASGLSGRSPILSGLTVVAPSALAAGVNSYSTVSSAAPARSAGPMPTTTRALFEAAKAQVARVEEARHAPAQTAESAPLADGAAPAVESREMIADRAADRTIAQASSASPEVARALRTVDLLFQAASPSASASGEPMRSSFEPSAGPRVAMPAGLGGLMTAIDAQRATTAPLARMTSSPSIGQPAPLGGTLARIAAFMGTGDAGARASDPMPSVSPGEAPRRETSTFAPVWAAPSTAYGSIASDRARAVDHVAWSDRWLARFVGASPMALAALDATREQPYASIGASIGSQIGVSLGGLTASEFPARSRAIASPDQVYLQPPMPAPALAAAIRGSVAMPFTGSGAPAAAARPAAPAMDPTRMQRVDDNEPVSDDIFAAIAAAAAAPAPRAPAPSAAVPRPTAPVQTLAERLAEARPLTPADVVRSGARPTLADLVAVSPPPAPDAGLSPGLASSPLAPAMAGVWPMPTAPTFDPRALFPEAVSQAYLGGFLARSAAPIGVVSSAPTMRALVSAAAFASSANLPGEGGEPAAPWMNAARAWSARDLAIAPPSLRLAEAAPSRVILSADVDAVRRGMAPPSATAAAAPAAARPAAPQIIVQPPAVAGDDLDATAGELPGQPPAGAAPGAAMSPAIEAELLTLRAALFAAPGSTSTPLAFADHLPLLSAATAAPSTPLSSVAMAAPEMPSLAGPSAAPSAAPSAPGSVAARAAAFAPSFDGEFPLPSTASHAMAAPAGARGLALPAVGGAALDGGGLPAGTYAPADQALAYAGASSSALERVYAMYAPNAMTSTGRPGSLAELALSWSVAEERAAANLAFDFVQPEMVLAAKVYGLSPAAAVQASRLAIAGPGAIASLATSVDLTFLRGFQQLHAQEAARAPSGARAAATSVDPAAAGSSGFGPETLPVAGAPSAEPAFAGAAAAPSAAAYRADEPYAQPAAPSLASEILGGARLPRGAFLWPEATVAALGLRAQSPDGVAGMPVVALELLAASAVADLGTWITAFPAADRERMSAVFASGGRGAASFAAGSPGVSGAGLAADAPSLATYAAGAASSPASPTAAATAAAAESEAAMGTSAADILAPQLASAPRDVRAQFEAIYISLARSGEGQMMSPAARAVRAMSMLARTDAGASLSPRDRALTAWSVLPQGFQGDFSLVAPFEAGAADGGVDGRDGRSGLAGLAARAGESLASFVSPSSAEVRGSWGAESTARSSASLADRAEAPVYVSTGATVAELEAAASAGAAQATAAVAPAAVRSLARPGRTFAQTGGGEPEIPAWFEAAARLALEQRAPGSGMSIAELVLVNAASTPSRAIAAATRGASASPSPSRVDGAGAQGNQEGEKPDVDKIAHEAYLEVLKLIDIARMRSGDPFQ